MINYVKDAVSCRSQIIAKYFNSLSVNTCGICDNCINQKPVDISKDEFEQLTVFIFQQINKTPLAANELLKQLNGIKKEKFWKVISYLQAEKKLSINSEGQISKL
jgi:ATP-dependent DNA helicase RecQ